MALAAEAERFELSPKISMTTRASSRAITFWRVGSSANGASGPAKCSKPYDAPRVMSASRSSSRGLIQPASTRAFQRASPLVGPKASTNFALSTFDASGPSRLPVARSRKLPSSPFAARVGSAWSARRVLTRWASSPSACSRERCGVSAWPAATVASSSIHWPIAVSWVNDRR